ncbi:MAG: diguanylate cyclase/phosphodiesterase with PAS/PAC sensor [Candidatus Scalindua rubra]|uniref:histidine kinase n=1 Tax=Candidatus Scalindua rubra TaxID=1872076 RepID=A0A1E3X6V9_9BACT|nr:MAG: diguanylate cyclase/phosphodiesterase with PAS/PAC sensor [Candidatus Scalindua rubra]
MFGSIRSKLVLFICLMVCLPIGTFTGFLLELKRSNISEIRGTSKTVMTTTIREEWEKKSQAIASLFAYKLIQPVNDLNIAEMFVFTERIMKDNDAKYVYVLDKKRTALVAPLGSKLIGTVLTDELTRRAVGAEGMITQRQAGMIDVAAPIMLGPKYLGTVRIGFSSEEVEDAIVAAGETISNAVTKVSLEYMRNILFLLPIILIPSLVVGILFSNRLAWRVKGIVVGTKRIAAGDIAYRIKIKSSDEIGMLTDSFNKMTEDLQKTTVSKDYLDNIIKNMVDTLVVVNPDTTIKTVNQATLNLLGYEEDELIGQPIEMIIEEEEIVSFKGTWITDLMKKGSITSVERAYITKDGRKIPVLFSASVIQNVDGEIQGYVCVALDITEQKRTEELKKKSERLERFHKLVTGREMEMVRLKEEVNTLLEKLGMSKKYKAPDKIGKVGTEK